MQDVRRDRDPLPQLQRPTGAIYVEQLAFLELALCPEDHVVCKISQGRPGKPRRAVRLSER